MKRLLFIFALLLLFANSQGQILRANSFARVCVNPELYGEELNPDMPCVNTAYWYEFGDCLAQAGGMTVSDGAGTDYVVSNPNSGWDASGTFHIVVTIDSYLGAGAGLYIKYGMGTMDFITGNGTYEYDCISTDDSGIYIEPFGVSFRITSLSIKKVL